MTTPVLTAARAPARDRAAGLALEHLARAVRRRVRQPVDGLEVAAALESAGITDAVAAQDYGAADTFELAERVFALLRRHPLGELELVRPRQQTSRLDRAARSQVLRSVVALAPVTACAALFLVLASSGWSTGSVLALAIGTTIAMIPANAFIQAIARRTAIYLGLGDPLLARQFVVSAGAFALATVALLAGIGVSLAGWAGLLTTSQRVLVWVAAVALAALWLLVAAVSLVEGGHWVLAALAAAVVGGLAVAWAMPSEVKVGAEVGVVTGYALAMSLLAYGGRRRYGPVAAGSSAFPPPWAVAFELLPYFAYGGLFMALLVGSHVFGWLAAVPGEEGRLAAIRTLELPLTVGLVPLLLAAGFVERSVRLFWARAERLQRVTAAGVSRRFGAALLHLHQVRLVQHQVVVAAFAALTFVAFELAVRSSLLPEVLRPTDLGTTELALGCSLIAYWHVGFGQFNCAFLLSLGVPRPAASAAFAAVAALTVTGVPLAAVSYRLTPIAFVVGSVVFAALSLRHCRAALARADYHYASAF